jgi:hypothetical protein
MGCEPLFRSGDANLGECVVQITATMAATQATDTLAGTRLVITTAGTLQGPTAMVAMVTDPPQMMTGSVRATILAGDREVCRQKSLNRSGDSSV